MQNKAIRVLSVVFAVLLLVGMGMCVYDIAMNENGFLGAIQPIFSAVVCAFGVYYVLAGCKKGEGSAYFKWFVNMFALTKVLVLITHSNMTIAAVLLTVIPFGCLTVLSVAKDYGQKKSTLLAAVIVVTMLIQLLLPVAADAPAFVLIRKIIGLLLAVTTFFMVCAKYADKKSRGSK